MEYACPTCGLIKAKRQPAFSSERRKYPNGEPIFIATDWLCVNYIMQCGGICLLCNYPPESYDLSLCNSKEVWILIHQEKDEEAPKRLAFETLRHNATKALIIPINPYYHGAPSYAK